ncbi:MAG TPA: hypothetical protein VLB74_00290 [Flavobacterium sp.]|uniref:hypothetical protein n=1 Tax=Flavobacterium sp. TaxID=239 RepID=UPI002CD8E52E|nr:hypothetical protein [Flavobacterium sp.]HSD13063.1 hypothetical protein [Flavobacterium sp.]
MRKLYIIAVLVVMILVLESFSNSSGKTAVANHGQINEKGFAAMIQKNPDTLSWKLLGEIKFLKKQDKVYGEVQFPVINTKLKQTQKKRIVMSGFIVPIDNKSYALSKNVFASCFFCGKSGPETIMGIKFRGGNPKLRTDQYVTIEGTFRYNDSNVDDWIYHIEDAVIVKGK